MDGSGLSLPLFIVGALFFPRSAELGLAVEDTASPRVLAKMVYSGTSAVSFAAASDDLAKSADLAMSDGGRYQFLDRRLPASGGCSARQGEH